MTEQATQETGTKKAEERGVALRQRANAIAINNAETYKVGASFVLDIADAEKAVHELCDPTCSATHTAWQTATQQRKKLLDPLAAAKSAVTQKMGHWQRVEKDRLALEAREREAEARRLEEEKKLAEAQAAADEGEKEEAEAILEEPTHVAPVIPQRAAPKVSGISHRVTWKAEVNNLKKLVAAIAKDDKLLGLVKADAAAVNAMARALKGGFNVPGVRVWEQDGVAARAR